ncbi:19905_t:CDS:1, partial [Racocetra persica]
VYSPSSHIDDFYTKSRSDLGWHLALMVSIFYQLGTFHLEVRTGFKN